MLRLDDMPGFIGLLVVAVLWTPSFNYISHSLKTLDQTSSKNIVGVTSSFGVG